jgi:Ser/Thr protein kinase RdoA (MazF antagonist)
MFPSIRWRAVDPTAILAHWPRGLGAVVPFLSGGLSGASLWRVGEGFILRATPLAQCSAQGLLQCHHWMRQARERGLTFVPGVVPTSPGTTLHVQHGAVWELQQWMPGEADRATPPSRARVRAACEALARLHEAWRLEVRSATTAPAIERRLAECGDPVLERWRHRDWSLRPCLVDLHREHVLFTADQVSGIVDYATMRWDIPHADLARLLGSMAEDEEQLWQEGLEAYERVAPLPEVELIRRLDRVGTWIAVQRWERWHRSAGTLPPVARERHERLAKRVERWRSEGWRGPAGG